MQYTNVEKLIINRLSQEQYNALKEAGTLQDDELYMTPGGEVIDTLTSESSVDALSANQGRILKSKIDEEKQLGKFLAMWDAETGLPVGDLPREVPFDYSIGDYYRVGNVGETNHKPDGSQYSGEASTAVETDEIEVGIVYYYDGDSWKIQAAGGKVRDVQINGTTILDGNGIANINIVDNLNSTETTKALSANQGRALSSALSSKANLENGKVPLSELPEFVIADVVEVETYSALPAQGQSGVVYYTKDDGKSYRWVGAQYVEISQRANYYSLEVGTSASTMGQLRTLINNVNTAGDHVFLDLHSYLTDGYVCTVHMYTENNVNYCQILDLLYHRIVFDPSGYDDSTLISTYCSTASNIWASPRDVTINGTSIIEDEIASIPMGGGTQDTAGVVWTTMSQGLQIATSGAAKGRLEIYAAQDNHLVQKTQQYTPIVPAKLDKAVMEGLGNNSLTWSAAYKAAARDTIGIKPEMSFLCEMASGETKTLKVYSELV